MKGKSITKVVVCVSLFVFIMSMGLAYAKEDKPITLRYTAHAPPKGTRPKAVMWWAEQIEKRSKGLVKIKFFWSDALLKAGDCLEGVGRGTADLGATWGIYHPAKNPLWTVGDPPFSHSDPYAALKAIQELYKTYDPMIKELEAWNVKFLAPFVTDMSQVGGSKKAMLVPDDVKGRKVRYAGGEWAKLWKACGAYSSPNFYNFWLIVFCKNQVYTCGAGRYANSIDTCCNCLFYIFKLFSGEH